MKVSYKSRNFANRENQERGVLSYFLPNLILAQKINVQVEKKQSN